MAFDLWTHQFCLGCDKQTDGATYCSESCRLADFEKTCTSPSTSISSASKWPIAKEPAPQHKFFLPQAYDFSRPQAYGSTPRAPSSFSSMMLPSNQSSTTRTLTPSSSHSSLCSMQSSSSTASSEGYQLSEKSKKELHAYHMSFESTRLQRRRSY